MPWLRALLFYTGLYLTVVIYVPLALLTFPLPLKTRVWLVSGWARLMMRWLALTCGLRYRVEGGESLPPAPYVILSKHASAWETMALQEIFPPACWVAKRELLWIPLFGWGLAMTGPIAIDRSAGQSALDQVIRQGKDRLGRGLCVVIFPEGTRVPFGQRKRYKTGGAALACAAGVPAVPVAHDAGRFWGRRSIVKRPGVITLSIGPPIATAGREAGEVNAQAEAWIEGRVAELHAAGRAGTA